MEDIYQWYRKGLLFYGPYRAYYGSSRKPFSEYVPNAQYSGERLHSRSEPERKTLQNEIQPTKTIETKQEGSPKTETSQKIEQKKETLEKQNEISSNKIVGPAEYQTETGRTDIRRKRPASPYDMVEMGW